MYTKEDKLNFIKELITEFEQGNKDIYDTTWEIEMWLQSLKQDDRDSKKIGFPTIEDAIEYYWDQSRNPNDSYEINYELAQGEKEFCEMEGFQWPEWGDAKQKMFLKDLEN